ncbi:hypothetical protein ARMSODRAFT_1058047 [Armillaria solidipes]|uniref:Uncharacterized protein n=1 Tax=Armillaria solidipes TaxID=1076256 RepID=A0A2H3BB56_9AGAR|nr:hypothetical protein ARMSODRAFT_1058047 [Armillaria solidipes]
MDPIVRLVPNTYIAKESGGWAVRAEKLFSRAFLLIKCMESEIKKEVQLDNDVRIFQRHRELRRHSGYPSVATTTTTPARRTRVIAPKPERFKDSLSVGYEALQNKRRVNFKTGENTGDIGGSARPFPHPPSGNRALDLLDFYAGSVSATVNNLHFDICVFLRNEDPGSLDWVKEDCIKSGDPYTSKPTSSPGRCSGLQNKRNIDKRNGFCFSSRKRWTMSIKHHFVGGQSKDTHQSENTDDIGLVGEHWN